MISIVLSWLLLLIMSYCLGSAVLIVYDKCFGTIEKWSADYYVVSGIMILTVYSEMFSIFNRLGSLALLVSMILCVIVFIISVKKQYIVPAFIYNSFTKSIRKIWLVAISLLIIYIIASYTDVTATYGDTYSYHNQAIQWLNKYGVVPGLGNFHHRFAYNSAFLPLQALFSFNWLLGVQLHTVNGFFCVCICLYAVLSNNLVKRQATKLSDILKCGVLAYVFYTRIMISCPGTDIMPNILSLYIVMKWAECLESEEENLEKYCILAILTIFNATVKLSFVAMVLLIVFPLAIIIKNKRYDLLIINAIMSFLIVTPWLIRNVIISGYLVYPLPALDLFSFDWKIPISVALYDKYEIIVWARNLYDVELYNLPFREWFINYWWVKESLFNKILMVIGIVAVIICIINIIICIKNNVKKNFAYIVFMASIVFNFIYWLSQAPSMRFGMGCIIMPISVALYLIFKHDKMHLLRNLMVFAGEVCFLVGLVMNAPRLNILKYGIVFQIPYTHYNTRAIELDGYRAYTIDDIEGGTDVFPYVPYEGMLDKIELRSENLSDGFKMKDEYTNASLTDSGGEWIR